MINIKGLSKPAVLVALCNATTPAGLGALHANGPVTEEQAAEFLARGSYVDYCFGRPIKVDFSGDEFDPVLFNRDAGHGAAERAIERLRASL